MKARDKYLLLASTILVFFIFNFSGSQGENENEKNIAQQTPQPTVNDKKVELESREEIRPKEIVKENEGKGPNEKEQLGGKEKEEYEFVEKWDEESIGEEISPGGIAIDSKGYVYVSDLGNHSIQIFKKK